MMHEVRENKSSMEPWRKSNSAVRWIWTPQIHPAGYFILDSSAW